MELWQALVIFDEQNKSIDDEIKIEKIRSIKHAWLNEWMRRQEKLKGSALYYIKEFEPELAKELKINIMEENINPMMKFNDLNVNFKKSGEK